MKRKMICILILIVLIPLKCFAINAFLDLYNVSADVDLGAGTFRSHTANATYSNASPTETSSSNRYYESQRIGSVGIDNITGNNNYGKITVSVELLSAEWCYVLNDDGTIYKRPFGIDLFARGTKNKTTSDIANYSLRIGNQSNADNTKMSVEIPQTTVRSGKDNYYSKVWWEICLVLDPVVTNGRVVYNNTTYDLLDSDAYYTAQIRVTVTCIKNTSTLVSESYDIYLSGYYNPGGSAASGLVVNMAVVPTSGATAIDIRSLFGNGSLDVAAYNLITNNIQGNSNGTISLFLSSSNIGTIAGDRFALVKTGAAQRTNRNSIEYNAKIVPTSGSSATFTGNDTINTTSNHLVLNAVVSGGYSHWQSEGTIQIEIPSTQSLGSFFPGGKYVDGLSEGTYHSNIYVHIVTDNV